MQEPKKYTEKRHFLRMQIQSQLSFQVSGDPVHYSGESQDFNAIGIRFTCSAQIPCRSLLKEGNQLEFTLTPASHQLAPLVRQAQIVRIWAEDSLLQVACRLLTS